MLRSCENADGKPCQLLSARVFQPGTRGRGVPHHDACRLGKQDIGKRQLLSALLRNVQIGHDTIDIPALSRRDDGAVIIYSEGKIGVQPCRKAGGKFDIVSCEPVLPVVAEGLRDSGRSDRQMLRRGRGDGDIRHCGVPFCNPPAEHIVQRAVRPELRDKGIDPLLQSVDF